jgi:serine/threonine protein kinase
VAGVRAIFDHLARAVRVLHEQGFYHKDLKTRNILVRRNCPASSGSRDNEPELFFFDCPSGRHLPHFLFRRAMVRDLAHLEEGLHGHVRRVDLLYLYKQYRGCNKLSSEDKTLARDALSYYAQRRMTRKRRLRAERKRTKSQH